MYVTFSSKFVRRLAATPMSNEADGMNHLPTLTVKSVKMVAATCP